ncbi:MAG: hypothetical protein GF317_00230 [Candidatus Lokiarchaeota archaeon]|nr:hypothetical protein [Candidatus Lokiarchaeota archaeon]MBD3198409.1 hypothetical protein [Candidatus Lokiarchaeota archaeon]
MLNHLILGLDIGGANTKAALLKFEDDSISQCYSYIEYFPFWERAESQISKVYKRICDELLAKNNLTLDKVDYIAITMTAELSDAFETKNEGIKIVKESLVQFFSTNKLKFITTDCEFINHKNVSQNYEKIAAANWVSTALYLGTFVKNCILIDSGSTTIDIIPIKDSIPATLGKTDVDRMLNHELIYTGGLRATIPSITHHVPYKSEMVRISFEKFALISDVHRILSNITNKEYINETADQRSTSLEHCYARLARMLCLDLNHICEEELDNIAKYIYTKQMNLIEDDLKLFFQGIRKRNLFPEGKDLTFIITGLSANFLVRDVLKSLGFNKIENYEDVTNIPDNISSSAYAVAGTLYNTLKNGDLNKL